MVRQRVSYLLLWFVFVTGSPSLVIADIEQWQSSATAQGSGFIATDIFEPTEMDIGEYDLFTGGGITYEIIYNADVGGPSSALLGSFQPPVGDSAGIKLDQWNATGKFGTTLFGVEDFSSVEDSIFNEDTHATFVADEFDVTLYINGDEADVLVNAAFALSGLTGIGHAYNHSMDSSIDPLNGTILGVAVYDSALAPSAIAANYESYLGLSGVEGDYNLSGDLDAGDLDFISQAIIDGENTADANGDGMTDANDRLFWINELQNSYVGDSNFDGEFGSSDLVKVFSDGKYETGEAAGYAQGDWDGDLQFDSADFVAAFTGGGYEQGPQGPRAAVATVPEPATASLLLLAGIWLLGLRRQN